LAGNIDFARHPLLEPAASNGRGNSGYFNHFTNKFVSGSTAKIVVAVQNFYVGIADPRQPNPH
jgi:hypothetical protein